MVFLQLIIYAAYNAFNDDNEQSYCLLRCIRAYIELDLYLGLEVHTTSTLAAGRSQQQKFAELMEV